MDFNGVRGRSSSWTRRTWKYEVFLSFRGEDTRHGFIAHLFAALQRKGIFPFLDDKRLHMGEPIRPELLKAIEESRISMVVFSKNYADSTWCLDELAKISEGILEPGCTVIPIFYDVDPSDVREQSGDYKKFFDEHEKRLGDRVHRWKSAWTQVANLAGYDVRKRSESDIIDEIVTDAIRILGHRFHSLADDLVGMRSRAEAVEKLLDLESDDVRLMVGIWGMPGVGKTTLAAVVYDRISHQFEASCLLLDVSSIVREGPTGLVRLQKQLLRKTLQYNEKIWNHREGTDLISKRLGHLKTLIVVDNVDHVDQLEKLVGNPEWFGAGSRIIITSRDKHILSVHGVTQIHEVEQLKDDEALQLLCRKAFKRDDPLSDFRVVTHTLLQYAQALPLAIVVLGSRLFGRQKSKWSSELERLKKIPNADVMQVLETSLIQLDYGDLASFLDIACFFKGADVSCVKKILDYCGFHPAISISVLRERSLLSIVNGTLWMHDLLQELGRKIAKREFPDEPAKWSRLWSYQDLQVVNTGTEKVEAIVLNEEVPEEIVLKAEVLSQMSHLRILILPDVKFSGNLSNLSNSLRFLSWHKFSFSYLPASFEPYHLKELIMPDSNIRQLWEGRKILGSLRSIDLSGSKSLVETPDLSGVRSLETLNLEGCTGLLHVHPSIGTLEKLLFFNLRKCSRLISIPNNIFLSSSLQTLNLSHCSRLGKTN